MTPPLVDIRPAVTGDAPALARLHAAAFDTPWSVEAIEALLAASGGFALWTPPESGFILCRRIADEAEILTIAVAPAFRRRGLGLALATAAANAARGLGATRLFLEVARDNVSARGLYAAAGFIAVGERAGYYVREGGAVDALVLRRDLNR